jgi:hypothetical protein
MLTLRGVIGFYGGKAANSVGHYVAYCRRNDNNWQVYDDRKNHAETCGASTHARTICYQDRSIGFSEVSFRFQPGAATTQRPASETNVFTTGYTESTVFFDECAIILATKTFIKFVRFIH